jgi:hypothetical protein
MKKIFFVAIAGMIFFSSCVKNPDLFGGDNLTGAATDDHGGINGGGGGTNINASSVPDAVLSAFKSEFSSAAGVEWKLLNNGNYKVQFRVNGVKWEAVYSAAGAQLSLQKD